MAGLVLIVYLLVGEIGFQFDRGVHAVLTITRVFPLSHTPWNIYGKSMIICMV